MPFPSLASPITLIRKWGPWSDHLTCQMLDPALLETHHCVKQATSSSVTSSLQLLLLLVNAGAQAPRRIHLWRHPASPATWTSCSLATWLMACNYQWQVTDVWIFTPYSLLITLLQQWLELVQLATRFVFNSSTTSVKVLGLLPLFAAVIAKFILFCVPLHHVLLFFRTMERIFVFVQRASQTAHFPTAAPSLHLP